MDLRVLPKVYEEQLWRGSASRKSLVYLLGPNRAFFLTGELQMKCKCRNPPGDEIYRDGAVSIFEVDGRKNKVLITGPR